MSRNQYLDELDNLLDNQQGDGFVRPEPTPATLELDEEIVSATMPMEDNTTQQQASQVNQTWAEVIESASQAMQDSSNLSQEAIQKNIELAKTQQESIKELADAAGGWRHATRQAVQEVNAAKKNVITLTIISGLIAIAGFGTTIGVMLQNKSSYIHMSNLILENVDEHQTLVSKTLTLKMDELSSTVEQMQATLALLAAGNEHAVPERRLAKQALEIDPDSTSEAVDELAHHNSKLTDEADDSPNETADKNTPLETTADAETTEAPTAIVDETVTQHAEIENNPTDETVVVAETTMQQQLLAPLAELADAQQHNLTPNLLTSQLDETQWQQLIEQIDALKADIKHLENKFSEQTQTQDQQFIELVNQTKQQLTEHQQQLNSLVEKSLQQPANNSASTDAKSTPVTTTETAKTADTTTEKQQKILNNHVYQLRKDMNELRVIQQNMREQINGMEQQQQPKAITYEEGYRYRSQD